MTGDINKTGGPEIRCPRCDTHRHLAPYSEEVPCRGCNYPKEPPKNNYEKLAMRHPALFPKPPACGVSYGDGWHDLIDTLCKVLTQNCIDEDRAELHTAQIKEKFGGLRFYVDGDPTPWQYGAIAMAEAMSFKVCETCGQPGRERNTNWIKTLCDDCAKTNEMKQWRDNAKYRIASLEHRLKELTAQQEVLMNPATRPR